MGQPAGPEAEGGLLADFAVAIGDRVLRVAVDADHAVDLHCNARLLQNLPSALATNHRAFEMA